MTETRIETIGALIHQQALRDPAAGAVFAEQSVAFTYGELLQQMRSVAAVIRAANFGPRQRIALVLPNGPEMATAFLTISAVCACAPLNPGYREKELEFYLGDLNADGVVVAAGKDNGVRSVTSRLGLRVFELFTKAEYPAGRFDLNTLPTATDTEFDEPGPEDVALLLHTSGTTSRPKLVPLTHANLVRSANNIASTLALGRHDRCLNVMPLFHIHGLIGAVLSTIVSGGQLFCARAFASGPFFTWLREFRPTWYTAVPTIHQAILGEMRQGRGPRRYDGFRFIRSSSSSLPTTVMRELEDQFGVPAIESYGMTEAAHQMASNPLPPRARKPGSAGLPAGPAITILDNEGRQLDAKVKGEIAIRGDNVTRGYERNPDANRKSFTDGWFRTGDQGYLDDEGYLFITGRIKELVNRGGQKIAPLEVEEILLSHEAVDEAACFAVPHTRLGEDLAAAVTVTGPGWDGVKLRKFVSQYLVDYKVPSQILIVDDIPKGPTGKLQRVSLADRLNHLLKVEYVPPRDDIEKLLADVWTRVLDIERIGLLDNVYLLGADSIAVTRALASINQRLSIELSVDIVFEAPTIREQALRVDLFRGRSRSSLDKASRITRKYRAEAPLSYAQERLWFLDQLEAGFIEHNRPTNLQLIGPVDVSILERTLNLIVDRHAVLRTAFTERDGQPLQQINKHGGVVLAVTDLTMINPRDREQQVSTLVRQFAREPFNLSKSPIMRANLIRLAENECLLSLVFHHLVFDGWSQSVFNNELVVIYDVLARNEPISGMDLPFQYADFSVWQRQDTQQLHRDRSVEYWKSTIGTNPEPLALPIDFPRPAEQTYRGARHFFDLSVHQYESLRRFSREQEVTVFTILLSLYAALLQRYTWQDRIVVGVPFSGRTQAGTESLLGLFINTLPIAVSVDNDPSFVELVAQVHAVVQCAHVHQDVPLQDLTRHLLTHRDLSRSPLFQALFIYEHFPQPPKTRTGLNVRPIEIDMGKALLDISLELIETADGIGGHIEYPTDLFSSETIAQFARHLNSFMDAALENPGKPISAMPLIDATDEAAVLNERYRMLGPQPGDETMLDRFDRHVRAAPERVALSCNGRSMTYLDLDRRANRLAHYLRELGIGPGSLVGLCLGRGLDMPTAILAVLRAGAAYVPLDPEYPAPRLAYMLADSRAALVLVQGRDANKLAGMGALIVDLDEIKANLDRQPETVPRLVLQAHETAYVIYTSGSTGEPKGVVVSHGNLLSAYDAMNHAYRIEDTVTTHLQVASFSFDVSVGDWIRALGSGGRLVLCDSETLFDGASLYRLLRTETVDCADFNKVILENLLDYLEDTDQNLAFMRLVIVGGEAWPVDRFERIARFLGSTTRLANSYGVTETTIDNAYFEYGKHNHPNGPWVPVGKPLNNSVLHVLDTALRPVPEGVVGEVYIGGPCVARGYLNRPELTEERFIQDPFSPYGGTLYRTGDCARYRRDGNLEFLGRDDRQIKLRGFRVEVGEVETVVRRYPSVKDAVVELRNDASGNRILVAYVVLRANQRLSGEELTALVREELPAHLVPAAVIFLANLPLTASGKLDRARLPAPEPVATLRSRAPKPMAPANALEGKAVQVWAKVFNVEVEELSLESDFFQMGGHSLLAIRLMNEIERDLGVRLSLRTLFGSSTVRGLIEEIKRHPHKN